MPEMQITVSDNDLAMLEQVRESHGLPSIEEAAIWLVKSRIREQMKRVSGRGRAMFEVKRGNGG